MRRLLVVIHRWFGLSTALFLTLAGLTGALMAWDHELDALLNPELFTVPAASNTQSPLQLADAFERSHPEARVRYMPLHAEPGRAVWFWLSPRKDAISGRPHVLTYDQVALNPSTGEVLGTRLWGTFAFSRRNIMPFLYRLHYSLHLPSAGGVDVGMLLMGTVAVMWTLDAFIALWISFPNLSTWRKSFGFRWGAGGYRLLFDAHRSGGVWVWPLLLVLAITAVSMNLRDEVMKPVVRLFSSVPVDPFESREPDARAADPFLTREQILEHAVQAAQVENLHLPVGGVSFLADLGLYSVGFFEPGDHHGDGGLGAPWLYLDAHDGRLVSKTIPGEGSAGEVFLQLQFPLHSGRILGVWGRALVSLLGLMIATLSVTGIVIWARKRRARVRAQGKEQRA